MMINTEVARVHELSGGSYEPYGQGIEEYSTFSELRIVYFEFVRGVTAVSHGKHDAEIIDLRTWNGGAH